MVWVQLETADLDSLQSPQFQRVSTEKKVVKVNIAADLSITGAPHDISQDDFPMFMLGPKLLLPQMLQSCGPHGPNSRLANDLEKIEKKCTFP